VRARGLVGKAGGPKEPLTEVPDRAPTRAALGLWLALLEPDGKGNELRGADAPDAGLAPARLPARDERLTRPAAAAAHWLARQQTASGAWAVLHPPDAPRGKGTRLVRLDDPDYRDTALALLLAGDVLGDAHLKFVSDRSLNALVACRVATGRDPRPTLWQAAYALDGLPQQKFTDLPQGTDLLASRRAMEVLLCAHLIGSDEAASAALSEAAAAIAALPRKGDAWSRHHDRRGRPLEAAIGPSTRPAGFFEAPIAPELNIPLGIGPVLAAAEQVRRGDEEPLRQSLERGLSLRQRVAAILCGAPGQLFYNDDRRGDSELGRVARESERVRELWLALRKLAGSGKS
jgi:hypothetical protein